MIRALFAALLLALGVPAWAGVTLSQFAPNPGILPGGGWQFTPGTTFAEPPPPRAWVNGTYGGVPGAKLSVPATLNGPAGQLAVTVSRSASVGAIVGAAARCLGNPICMTAAAAGAAVLADYFGQDRISPKDGGGLLHDPGVSQVQVAKWRYGPNANSLPYESAAAACAALAYSGYTVSSCVTGSVGTCAAMGQSNLQCTVTTMNAVKNGWPGCPTCQDWQTVYIQGANLAVTECPASVDPLNPAYSIPAGAAPDADGKCKQARYHHAPISVADAEALKATKPPADPGAVAESAVKGGESIDGKWEPTSGPASQIGTPKTTTTTNPNGTTTTTTQTPTYTYNYGAPNITYNTTTVTVTNNAGDVTTTTTTTTQQNPETDPENPCVKNPDSSGCAKLGTPPDAELIPKELKPAPTWSPVSFAAPAGCPAPVTFELYGPRSISYQPLCDVMSTLRPLFIALASIGAGFIFMGAFRIS